MSWLGTVETVAVVGALLVAAFQTRRLVLDSRQRDSDQRVGRALELSRDLLVESDTASAFHRVSVRLRQEGWQRFTCTTWYLPTDYDFDRGGLFGPDEDTDGTLFADFYRVIWFFERAELSLDHRLIDEEVFFQAAAFHVWWWNEVLREVDGPKAMAATKRMGGRARQWAKANGVLEAWKSHCARDFNGGPPVPSSPKSMATTSQGSDRTPSSQQGPVDEGHPEIDPS